MGTTSRPKREPGCEGLRLTVALVMLLLHVCASRLFLQEELGCAGRE